MQYTTINFDLFGTLVGDFSRTHYEDVYMRIAGEVHISYDVFSHAFGQTFERQSHRRCRASRH
jgi:hypothetical protein